MSERSSEYQFARIISWEFNKRLNDLIWVDANGLEVIVLFLWEKSFPEPSCIYVQKLCNVFVQYLSPWVIYFLISRGKRF